MDIKIGDVFASRESGEKVIVYHIEHRLRYYTTIFIISLNGLKGWYDSTEIMNYWTKV